MERLLIGGQAVIEGVMMRSPRWTATAVRRPGGDVVTYTARLDSLLVRFRWLRAPGLRGVIALSEALAIGVRALILSVNAVHGPEKPLTPRQVSLTVLAGVLLAVGLFVIVPAAVIRWLDPYFATVSALNLAEGALRVIVLMAYIAGIGTLPDIRRVFAYHGAEHKAVNAYEAGAALTPGTVRTFSRFHPRCGTTFLLVVMVVAIAVFSWLGRPPLLVRVLSRVAMLPVVVALSYEVIRAGARFPWFRPLVLPGMWLQRLTTREPDDGQLEVAVRALTEVVELELTG